MKNYLASAGLEEYLAWMPAHAELRDQRRNKVWGEFVGDHKPVFASLKEEPHQIFVNWLPTPEGVVAFTKRYGLLDPKGTYLFHAGNKFSLSVSSWVQYQKKYQLYWDSNADWRKWTMVRFELSEALHPGMARGDHHPGILVNSYLGLGLKPDIKLAAATLWQYLCALLIFHPVGSLRQCRNPGCSAPRFISRRQDQVFCSSDCAGLVSKRRWWAKHGKKWRADRKKRKGGRDNGNF